MLKKLAKRRNTSIMLGREKESRKRVICLAIGGPCSSRTGLIARDRRTASTDRLSRCSRDRSLDLAMSIFALVKMRWKEDNGVEAGEEDLSPKKYELGRCVLATGSYGPELQISHQSGKHEGKTQEY